MLFSFSKEKLLKLFKFATTVVAEKKFSSTMNSSACVLLSVKDNEIQLTATDFDVELIITEDLNSESSAGQIVVPLRKLQDICRAMSDCSLIQISTKDDTSPKLHILAAQTSVAIKCLPASFFPVIDLKVFETEFKISSTVLQNLIEKVIFAVGDLEGRLFLSGVLLQLDKQTARSVAADGHRLMLWEPTLTADSIEILTSIEILIPQKSAMDLLKILGDVSPDLLVDVCVGKNHFRVSVDNIIYTSKLLTEKFPSFKKLFPPNLTNVLTISKDVFKNCLVRATIVLGDSAQGIKLIFNSHGIQVSGINDQEDSIEEHLAGTFTGEPMEAYFNIKYLLDFLANMDGDIVIFKVGGAVSGALIQDNNSFGSYVLMPMQV